MKYFCAFLLFPLCCFSQNEDIKPSVIPPHPDAAALGKYGDFPMNNYTGTPAISIPLFEIVENDIKVPVSLSYDASGIKVSQTSSWVGLGWVLNAGGVITRSVRGRNDGISDYNYATSEQAKMYATTGFMSGGSLKGDTLFYAKEIAGGRYDAEADLYFYNFSGRSGKFIEGPEGTMTLERSELKIDKISHGWKITDENGYLYTFDSEEETLPNNYKDVHDFASSWYLTSIQSPNGSLVTFQYKLGGKERTPFNKTYSYNVNYNALTGLPNSLSGTRSMQSYSYSKKRLLLDKIIYTAGQVVFTSAEDRLDGLTSDGANATLSPGYALRTIDMKSATGQVLKRFCLDNNNYFHNGNSGYANYRMRLDGITESLNDCDAAGQPTRRYQFEYYDPTSLPSVESENMDHWGYAKRSATFMPSYSLSEQKLNAGSRDPEETAVTGGTLKRIYFPTGGYSEFIFEPHNYSRIRTNLVNEDIITPVDISAKAKKPIDPPNFWFAQSYSDVFWVDATTQSMKLDIVFDYTALQNVDQLRIEIIDPTFALNSDPIPANIISEEVVATYRANHTPVSEFITLAAGRYMLKATNEYNEANPASVTSFLRIMKKTGIRKVKTGGGLRIQKIVNFDPVQQKTLTRKFRYVDGSDSTRSSGVLVSEVAYDIQRKIMEAPLCFPTYSGFCPNMPGACTAKQTNYLEIRSSSSPSLGETHGSAIGYKRVIVESLDESSNTIGKTIETYSSPDQYPEDTKTFPFVSGTNWDIFRGQLLSTAQYDKSGNLLAEKIYKYEDHLYKSYWSVSIFDAFDYTGAATMLNTCAFNISTYRNLIGKSILKSTIEKTYTAANVLTKKTTYYTEKKSITPESKAHTFPTKTVEWISSADSITTNFTYAIDVTGNSVIDNMVSKHIIGPQTDVEKILSRGALTIYKRKNIFQLFGTKPLLASIQQAPTGGTLEESIRFDQYDSLGRIQQLTDQTGVTESYLWNKKLNLPMAKVTNCSFANVYVNDFEDNQGNSTDAHTGLKSRTGGFTYTVSGLTNGTFYLKYWSKQSGIWKEYSASVNVTTGSYSLSISGQVDNIRLYPVTAQVVMFTYDTAGRLINSLDENNMPAHYEYDGLGRLITTRDFDRSILKAFQYNLTGPNH